MAKRFKIVFFIITALVIVLGLFAVLLKTAAAQELDPNCLEWKATDINDNTNVTHNITPGNLVKYNDSTYSKECELRESASIDIRPLGSEKDDDVDFVQYIVRFYKFGMGIAGALALVMIVFGGLLITTSEVVGKKKEGIDMIKSAIWGIVLLFGAHLLLRTINPQLVKLKEPGLEKTVAVANNVCIAGLNEIDGEVNKYMAGVNRQCSSNESPAIKVPDVGGLERCTCFLPEPKPAGMCPVEQLEYCKPRRIDLREVPVTGIMIKRIWCGQTLFGLFEKTCEIGIHTLAQAHFNAKPEIVKRPITIKSSDYDSFAKNFMNFLNNAGNAASSYLGLRPLTDGAVLFRHPFYEARRDGKEINDYDNAQCIVYGYRLYVRSPNFGNEAARKLYDVDEKPKNLTPRMPEAVWKPCTNYTIAKPELLNTISELKRNDPKEWLSLGGIRIPGESEIKELELLGTQGALATDAAVKYLGENGVEVHSSGGCSDIHNPTCTSLEGMPQFVLERVVQMKKDCSCDIAVTGGTEDGHSAHGPGRPVVDLENDVALARYIGRMGKGALGIKIILVGGVRTEYENTYGKNGISPDNNIQNFLAMSGNDPSTQSHFHIEFLPTNPAPAVDPGIGNGDRD